MDSESKQLLEKTFKLSKENNEMLHKIRSIQKWQSFWSMMRFLLIIAISLGVAYYIQPYFEKVMNIFNQVSGTGQTLTGPSLQELLKNIKP